MILLESVLFENFHNRTRLPINKLWSRIERALHCFAGFGPFFSKSEIKCTLKRAQDILPVDPKIYACKLTQLSCKVSCKYFTPFRQAGAF